MERITIHPENPQERLLNRAVDIIRKDGICIYPTDTVYGVGCAVSNTKNLKVIAEILHRDASRLFSFVCSDFAQAEAYAKIDNRIFKILNRYLPGPYTFILPSTHFVQKKISQKRKTVGIRIPDYSVTQEMIRKLGEPLANMSLNAPGDLHNDPDLFLSPEVINGVDVMLDVGILDNGDGSTIIDLTDETGAVLVRQGKGIWYE